MSSGRERLVRDSSVARAKPMVAGKGRPLDAGTRARMEASFGVDLSRVRVHSSASAARSARAMGANAYALGNDIVFGAGRYAPGTVEGEGLIAHEVGHVVDQTQRGAPHQIMRQAGSDPLATWDALVTFDVAGPKDEVADRLARAKEAKARLAKTNEGAILLNQLWSMFAKGHKTPTTKITVHFGDSLPKRAPAGAAGYFEPDWDGASSYEIWVKDVASAATLGGMWPSDKAPMSYYADYTDPPSVMAATLFHELLHVWFTNQFAGSGRTYPTGHGPDVEKGQFETEFFDRLEKFNADLVALEDQTHKDAAPPPAEPTPQVDLDASEPAPRRQATTPRWIGGEVTVGGMAGKGAAGIVGADVILGKIHALDVGVRGIYLAPNHLFVGGSVGYRKRQESSGLFEGTVQRPIYFNLELGVLRELSQSETDRFTNKFAGFASVGVGQEYGRSSARFVWRVGGFVLVSDKNDADGHPDVAAGVAGNVGVAF